MAQYALLQYGAGVVTGDTAANASTIVARDSQGNIAGAQMSGSELKTTGVRTNPSGPTKTTAFTADATSVSWYCDATGGAYNATLPPAATCPGRKYRFLRINGASNAVTVKGNGAELINSANTYALSAQWKWLEVESDGTQWWGFGN